MSRVEREVTARLRAAQDEAYAESLAADQEKERRRAAARAARAQRDRDQARRQQLEEQRRQDVRSRVDRGNPVLIHSVPYARQLNRDVTCSFIIYIFSTLSKQTAINICLVDLLLKLVVATTAWELLSYSCNFVELLFTTTTVALDPRLRGSSAF